MTILELVREVRNTFYDGFYETGGYAINDGIITISGDFWDGCYIFLADNVNFGLYNMHKTTAEKEYLIQGAKDGSFTSPAFRLKIPPDFISLTSEIEAYIKKTPDSNIVSEKFGEYSYSLAKSSDGRSWEKVFASRLNRYRKMTDSLLEFIAEMGGGL